MRCSRGHERALLAALCGLGAERVRELLSFASCLCSLFSSTFSPCFFFDKCDIFFFPRTSTSSFFPLSCSLVLPRSRGWETFWQPPRRFQHRETSMSAPPTPTADAGKDAWNDYNARIMARQGELKRRERENAVSNLDLARLLLLLLIQKTKKFLPLTSTTSTTTTHTHSPPLSYTHKRPSRPRRSGRGSTSRKASSSKESRGSSPRRG